MVVYLWHHTIHLLVLLKLVLELTLHIWQWWLIVTNQLAQHLRLLYLLITTHHLLWPTIVLLLEKDWWIPHRRVPHGRVAHGWIPLDRLDIRHALSNLVVINDGWVQAERSLALRLD